MIGEVVAMVAMNLDLLDEPRMIVDRRGAFHLAPLHNFFAVGGVVEVFGRADVLCILPDVGGLALVLIPPAACSALGRGADVIDVRLDPGLRRARCKPVIGNDAAARILGLHKAQNALEVGIREIRPRFVLQNVFDDRGMTAVGANHADDLGFHIALGEASGLARTANSLDSRRRVQDSVEGRGDPEWRELLPSRGCDGS